MSKLSNVQGERDIRTRRPIYDADTAERIAKPTSDAPLVKGGQVRGLDVESDLPFNTTAQQKVPGRRDAEDFFADRLTAPATGNPDANQERTDALDLEAMRSKEADTSSAAAGDPTASPEARAAADAEMKRSQDTGGSQDAAAAADAKKAGAAKGKDKG